MVNFRFHVVSILAIFLAIAIGTVMGAAFVGRGVVDSLQTRIDTVDRNRQQVESENRTVVSQRDELQRYVDQSAPITVQGRLEGVRVDVVAQRGIDSGVVDAQVESLRGSGAIVPGVLWLEDSWQLAEAGSAADLRAATGLTQRSPGVLRRDAADLLGTRLAALPPGNDVLGALARASFVTVEGAAGSPAPALSDFAGVGGRLLVLGGPQSDVPDVAVSGVVVGALDLGVAVVVGQVFDPENEALGRDVWLDSVVNVDAVRGRVSAVDDVELTEGRVASVLALAALAAGEVGRFGLDQERTVPASVPLTPAVPSAR